MILAGSILDLIDDVDWLVDLHSAGYDAIRRVARLEAYLAEAV